MTRRFRAPGRVNLIGEHTDYNDGFVLPMAIDLGVDLTVRERNDHRLAVTSTQLGETTTFDLAHALVPPPGWAGYVAGAVLALREAGIDVAAADVHVDSTLPIGAAPVLLSVIVAVKTTCCP